MFENLKAVCLAAGGDLQSIVKLNIYLTDLNNFTAVNEIMATYFQEPYPARAAVGWLRCQKVQRSEMDAIMAL